MGAKLKIDLRSLDKLVRELSVSGRAAHDELLIRWIVRYKKYAKAEYNRNSRGGGLWPPLKKNTRKRVKKRSRLILKDSDTLSKTLDPIPTLNKTPSPGIRTRRTNRGVVISFGGSGRHPYSKLSIAKLATVHHLGLGRVPRRTILVPVTDVIMKRMQTDVVSIVNKTKRKLGMS